MEELLAAAAAATRGTAEVVARIAESDLSRATPCAAWNLRELLAHLTAQHRGFAAAAAGHGGDADVWRPVDEDEPVKAHAEAAAAVIAAFAVPGAAGREVELLEVGRTVAGRRASG